MPSSLEQALANRPSSEHRRRIEFGLLDLMERALDLCAEYLDDEGMDEVLNRVSGFHQRIQRRWILAVVRAGFWVWFYAEPRSESESVEVQFESS